VEVDTGSSSAKAAIVDIRFASTVFEVVGGVAGVTEPASPAFNVLTPQVTDGRLYFSILEPTFQQISYSGTVAEFQFKALAASTGSPVTLSGETVFVPGIEGTLLQGAQYTVLDIPPTATSTPGAETPTPTLEPSAEAPTPTNTSATTPAPSATPTPGCDTGYYLLDSFGGRHRVGNPPVISGALYFGEDLARDLESTGSEGQQDLAVLESSGGVHFVEGAAIPQDFYFQESIADCWMFDSDGDGLQDQDELRKPVPSAVDVVVSADGEGFWVLADTGGIYRAGSAKPEGKETLVPESSLPCLFGHDVPIPAEWRAAGLAGQTPGDGVLDLHYNPEGFAHELSFTGGAAIYEKCLVVLDPDSNSEADGYIVFDSLGGRRHLTDDGFPVPPGGLSPNDKNGANSLLDPVGYVWPYFGGLDLLRDAELHPSQTGVVILDGWGGIHPVPVDDDTNPVFFANNVVSATDSTPWLTVGMPYVTAGLDLLTGGDDLGMADDASSIFEGLEFSHCEDGLYILDRFGGVFAFGTTRETANEVSSRFESSPYFWPLPYAEDMEIFGADTK
jgi:hypothetical protein